MNTAIIFDTETTGFPEWSIPSDDPCQPHIVQLAASMVNLDTRHVMQSINFIVRPDDWKIPEESQAVHGITEELAMDVGVNEKVAVESFMELLANGGVPDNSAHFTRIAHNLSFDDRIIRIALKRFYGEKMAGKYKSGESYCTMRASTNIVKCPPTEKMLKAGRRGYKSPNLGEAYEFFTGNSLVGAHNAMIDVEACMAVYFGIQDFNARPKEVNYQANGDVVY